MDDHVINVFPVYHNIMRITREGIEFGLFDRGEYDVVSLARLILTKERNALSYRQHRRSRVIRIRHTR